MISATNQLNSNLQTVGLSVSDPWQVATSRETLNESLDKNRENAPTSETKEPVTRATLSERGRELSTAEQREIQRLQQIDAEVRAHEQAHIRAGQGVVTSGPNYSYTTGPDGRQYAIAGEVGIDTRPEEKPEANIDKGQRIQDAALAPAQPSPQDYQVAAVGGQLENQGRADLAAEVRAAAEARTSEVAADSETQPPPPPEPAPAAAQSTGPEQAYATQSAAPTPPERKIDLMV